MLVGVLATVALAMPVFAEPPGGGASSATVPTELSAAQRATIAGDLIAKFQDQVRKTPGGDVRAWSAKLTKVVATADAANVLRATAMPTLDTMLAALNGANLANLTRSSLARASGGTRVLGSTTGDTVYTPLPNGRCRVADSRIITSPLPANTPRDIDVEDTVSYASQGGAGTVSAGDGSTNCGIPAFATAYAVSVLVLSPTALTQFRIYPNGADPATSGMVLTVGGKSVSDTLITPSCQSCAQELRVNTTSQVHYVIDVLGYFMRPEATALQCVNTADSSLNLAANGGVGNAVAPNCATGYTQTATNCTSSSWLTPFVWAKDGTCSARNPSANPESISASRTCCRVPGR